MGKKVWLLSILFLGILFGVFQLWDLYQQRTPISKHKTRTTATNFENFNHGNFSYSLPPLPFPDSPCVPATSSAECELNREWEVIMDPSKVDLTDGTICLSTPFRKHLPIVVTEDAKNASSYFPMSLHMRWRAPVFHQIDKLVTAFHFGYTGPDIKWSIGGLGFSRDDVWDRYRASVEGESIDPANPNYEEWAEAEPYLFVLRNAMVGVDGAVADCKGNIYHFQPGVCHSAPGLENYMRGVVGQIKKHFSSKTATYDKLFVIRQTWGQEFYHFMIECGTRIYPWLDWLVKENVKIVVASDNSVTREFLQFLGIKRENIIARNVRGDLVYLPNPNPCLFANAVFLRGTRQYILSRLKADDSKRTILFISREGASRNRHLLNQKALIARIQEEFPDEKIEIHTPNLALRTQFEMFSRAKIVIGTHGAGLSNLIACKPDTKVLEITNRMARNFFGEICAKLGLEYHLTIGSSPEKSNNDPVTADVEEVVEIVAKMLELGPSPPPAPPNFYLVTEPFPQCGDSNWKYGVTPYLLPLKNETKT